MGDDSDRISSLPDAILCHILSFLPTKESVSTSVLSKRWNPLWRSVPTFHFELDDICFYDSDDSDVYYTNNEIDLLFVQSVYEFLLSRDFRQPLQTFRLRYFTIFWDYFNIKSWLNFATTQGRVEHLDLYFNGLVGLPSFALVCKTLVVLKLKDLILKDLSSVDLPNLKVLHLISVGFEEDAYLAQLFYGCPNLEDLETESLTFSSVGKFRRLPKLVRANIHRDIILLEVVNNVQFLSICSMNKKELNFEFPNLTHIELGYLLCPKEWIEVLKMLKNTPRLRILVVKKLPIGLIIKDSEGVWPYLEFVPECITSHLNTCYLKGCGGGSKPEFQFARYILQNARYLQRMKISFYDRASLEERHEMIKELSLLSKCSETCTLSFA